MYKRKNSLLDTILSIAKQRVYFIVALSLFTFLSCCQYKDVSITGIQNFRIRKIDKKEMFIEIDVQLKNPNDFSFNIYSGKASIYLGKILLGKAVLQKKVHIPANSYSTYTLLLKTSFEKLSIQDILNNLNMSNIGTLKMDGYVKAGKILFRKKIKTEYEGKILNNLLNNFQFQSNLKE